MITHALRAAQRVDALIPRLLAHRREITRMQAEEAALLAEARHIADDWASADASHGPGSAEFAHRSIAAEIAAALRVSDRTIQRQIEDAAALVGDFPETFASFSAGEISPRHAHVIVAAGAIIDQPELRTEYEASLLAIATSESATRLAPIAKVRAEWFAGRSLDDRHRCARLLRRVWATDLDDGMGELHLIAPSVIVRGIVDRVTAIALAHREASGSEQAADSAELDGTDCAGADHDDADRDDRTLDELRADITADLLLATDPVAHNNGPTALAAIHATVSITVPVLCLIDDGERDPLEAIMLDGHSPIDVDTARMLTADAPRWDRILTHPITGAVLSVDRYRPSEQMRRHLRIRDQHCRFPGCRMPAARSDIDYTIDHARHGPTAAGNLAHLCRRHHTLKHQTMWSVVQRSGGVLEWTSPTGREYVDRPVSTVIFAPADDDFAFAGAPF